MSGLVLGYSICTSVAVAGACNFRWRRAYSRAVARQKSVASIRKGQSRNFGVSISGSCKCTAKSLHRQRHVSDDDREAMDRLYEYYAFHDAKSE